MRELLRALFVTGSGSLGTMLLGALTAKIIALVAGPTGIALYGQLRALGQMLALLASVNGNAALVRGIAAREGNEKARYARAAAIVYGGGTVAVVTAVLLLAPVLSRLALASAEPSVVTAVRALAGVAALGALASFVTGTLNGYRAIGRLAAIQVGGSLAAATLAYPLVLWGRPLAYVCLIAALHLVTSALGIGIILRRRWWRLRREARSATGGLVREHATLALTFLIVGLAGAAAHVALRAIYIEQTGLERAAFFEVSWTLSMSYLMLLLSSFGTYYQPTLAACRTEAEIQRCMKQTFRLSILIGAPLVGFVVAVKPLLITVLYSGEFKPALSIFRWMLIGDYFKIVGWVFGMPLIAFAERRNYFLSELAGLAVLVGGVRLLIEEKFEIAGILFLAVQVLYLAYVAGHAHRRYGVRLSRHDLLGAVLGLALVAGLSALTWERASNDVLLPAAVWAAAAAAFLLAATHAQEKRAAFSAIAAAFRRRGP